MRFSDTVKLRPGDLLAYKPKKTDMVGRIIDWASWGGGYCHAAILSDIKVNHKKWTVDLDVVESNTDTEPYGVREKHFDYDRNDLAGIDVYRLPCSLDDEIRVLEWCRARVGAPYDLLGFPSTWFRSIVCRAFGWKHYGKTKVALGLEKGYYCSELIATAFWEVTGTELHTQLHHSAVEPNALFDKKSRVYRVF